MSVDSAIFLVLFMKLFLGEMFTEDFLVFGSYIRSNLSSAMFPQMKMQGLHVNLFSGVGHPALVFTVVASCLQ